MQQTNQGHQLRESWEVEDAVASANQSAAIAQKYHKLTAQNVSAVSLEIDRLNQKLGFALNEISRLNGLIDGSRNTGLVWAIVGGIICNLTMSLVTAQFNPPQSSVVQGYQRSGEMVQGAIVEPVPQVQKTRTAQLKSVKRVKPIQKRG